MLKADVSRSCETSCVENTTKPGHSTYCCNDKDLCNGAVKPSSQLPVAAALFVGVAVAARLL